MVLESEPRLVIRQDPKPNDDQEHKVNNKSAHCRSSRLCSMNRYAHGMLSPGVLHARDCHFNPGSDHCLASYFLFQVHVRQAIGQSCDR